MDDLRPYTVEKHEGVGCEHCGADQMWDVVFHSGADDEIALSTAYGDEDEAEDIARDCNDAYAKGLTALKLAATEQATQAEAVLKERTRERDTLALSQGRLLGALKGVMMLIVEGKLLVRDIRGDGEPSWAIKQRSLFRSLQEARAAIAEATPEGDKQ